MHDISEKIIDKIKKENLKPAPKWHFLLKNYVIWILFVLSILIGSLTFSVILFFITSSGIDAYLFLNKNPLGGFILALPRFWLAFLLVFLAVAYYNYKHTKGGYKYNSYLIIILSVIISFILGYFLFFFGLGKKTDDILNNNIPIYRQNTMMHKQRMWNRPEQGFLIGDVVEFKNKDFFTIKDFNKMIWQIKSENASWIGLPPKPGEGMEVRIIGEEEGGFNFRAKIIKVGPGGCAAMRVHHEICR